jgi:hypothetical protein
MMEIEMNSSARDHDPSADAATAQCAAAKVGDWVVLNCNYPAFHATGPVSKVTAQRVYHPDWFAPTRESFSPITSVLFVGSETVAKRVSEMLKDSKSLCGIEQRDSVARHERRIAEIVSGATSASTTDDSRAPGMNPQPAIAKAQGTDQ